MNRSDWSPELAAAYQKATRAAGQFVIGARTEIRITGRDRVRVINNFCTADIRRLEPGQGAEAFILNVKGMILGHVAVYLGTDEIGISTVAHQAESLIAHFQSFVVSESVEFVPMTECRSLLVGGPSASAALRQRESSFKDLSRLEHRPAILNGFKVHCRRTDLMGLDGYEWVGDPSSTEAISNELREVVGAPLPPAVLETLRIEHRIPVYGIDIDGKNLPQEVGRDARAISFTKGCYLGQETVARLDALGHVNRHWVALRLEGFQVPPAGSIVEKDGKSIARITSATFSPKYDRPLALAYVRHGMHESNQTLATPWGEAQVVAAEA